jgi:hypothetical protein
MISITPAIWAIYQVKAFTSQPPAGVPVHPLRDADVDQPLLKQLLAHWDVAFAKPRIPASSACGSARSTWPMPRWQCRP